MALVGEAKKWLLYAVLVGCIPAFTLSSIDGCSRDRKAPQAAATPAPQNVAATSPAATPMPPPSTTALGPAPGAATAEQLQELASPIALYPDVLVAQILAASTYPTQVVEASRWLEQNQNLHGDQLAAAVNAQPWDPGIKSLTQFPPVLKTMNDNLAWTSALGEAYYNQPADVMNAIQTLRKMATDAGTLKTTPQQKVEVQTAPAAQQAGGSSAEQTIIIQPAQPSVVYVPQYNPQAVYGAPVAPPPGYTAPAPAPGYSGAEMAVTGLLSFGVGMAMGALINENNNDWNCDWNGGAVQYNKNAYVSRTNVVPVRYPAAYPAAGHPAGYPRPAAAGAYPRPAPYGGTRPPYGAAVPATRPYSSTNARQYAANNPNLTKPAFPNPGTLKSPPTATNLQPQKAPRNQPQPGVNRPAAKPATNRPATSRTATNGSATNRPATSARTPTNGRATSARADPQRGFGDRGNAASGRPTGALGGYEPGGSAQAASGRGQASLSDRSSGGGGFGNRSGASGQRSGAAQRFGGAARGSGGRRGR
jgi:hypothetical protein